MEAIGSDGCIAPIAKSPLDSARGRGYRRRRHFLRSLSPVFLSRVGSANNSLGTALTKSGIKQVATVEYVKG